MHCPFSAIVAVVFVLVFISLSINIIKIRRASKVPVGYKTNELMTARAVQTNFREYSIFFLILLLLSELNGAGFVYLLLTTLLFLIGRAIHIYSLLVHEAKYTEYTYRICGMALTFISLIILCIINLYAAGLLLF